MSNFLHFLFLTFRLCCLLVARGVKAFCRLHGGSNFVHKHSNQYVHKISSNQHTIWRNNCQHFSQNLFSLQVYQPNGSISRALVSSCGVHCGCIPLLLLSTQEYSPTVKIFDANFVTSETYLFIYIDRQILFGCHST